MIDAVGMRAGVGIVVQRPDGQVLWCRRLGRWNAWQFPQGGIHEGESPLEAMHRELYEELGLRPNQIECVQETTEWFSYYLPKKFRRRFSEVCVGQRQKWFLLRFLADDAAINLNATGTPEFDAFKWVDVSQTIEEVVDFKRDMYGAALAALSLLYSQ